MPAERTYYLSPGGALSIEKMPPSGLHNCRWTASCSRSGALRLSMLGFPADEGEPLYVCRTCAKEAKKVWEDLIGDGWLAMGEVDTPEMSDEELVEAAAEAA